MHRIRFRENGALRYLIQRKGNISTVSDTLLRDHSYKNPHNNRERDVRISKGLISIRDSGE